MHWLPPAWAHSEQNSDPQNPPFFMRDSNAIARI